MSSNLKINVTKQEASVHVAACDRALLRSLAFEKLNIGRCGVKMELGKLGSQETAGRSFKK